MVDVVLLTLGFVLFVLSIGYAYACDRLEGRARNDFRLLARCPCDRRLMIYLVYALLRPERF